ncbi:MAG: hypothetical protein ACP5N6_14815 [Anaerolineae bacterium]
MMPLTCQAFLRSAWHVLYTWLYPCWAETLPLLARRRRKDLLSDLRALAPVIHALGGKPAAAETFRAIQHVARWWP